MKYFRIAITTLIFASSLSAGAQTPQSGINRRMTRAVLDVYAKQLAENPQDYEVYFRRANEFYRHSEYLKALDDINKALLYIPSTDRDMRLQALMLRANIYETTGRPAQALDDLKKAAELDPASYVVIYQKANAEYLVGDYAAARADYAQLRQMNPRSVEAHIGLARIAVHDNNFGLAAQLADDAVNLAPSSADAYIRRASVRRMMKNDGAAVDDLLQALSIDPSNSRALKDLVDLANTSYGAVMSGLSSAISQAPRQGMLYYIRAVIAQAHYRYLPAIDDFRKIIDDNLYNYHGIYASLAECYYAIGRYDEALEAINHAIDMNRNVAMHFVVKSRILRAQNNAAYALSDASQALVLNTQLPQAVVEKGLCYMSLKDYDHALAQFGEAMLIDNLDPWTYMYRAWDLNDYLNQPVGASNFYRQVIDMPEPEGRPEYTSLRGFALLYTGDTDAAITWIQKQLAETDDFDGRLNYLAACLYAAAGRKDAALFCVETALQNGYANYYDWTLNADGRINVAPLRTLPEFHALLQRYASIFGR